ncbi:MAG: hypothetical protein HUK15_03420 [Bacteroidales bacterium]|nr:hypothetical protein [Bacteroidales bacterium]
MNKHFLVSMILILLCIVLKGQGVNSKAIEITNTYNESYTQIEGTKLKLMLPQKFVNTNAFTYENASTNSKISVQSLNGDINRNCYSFDKQTMLQAGIIVLKETFFKINGHEAMIIDGDQYIDNKEYAVAILLIGNQNETYMVMGSTQKPIQNKSNIDITNTLLSVIYDPNAETKTSEAFAYDIDAEGSGLKECKVMGDTRTFTDDGNLPSKTEEKISLTIRQIKLEKNLTDEQQKEICQQRFSRIPISQDSTDATPIKYNDGEHFGYEIFAEGTNIFQKKEFAYQLIIFANDRYFVFTGLSYGNKEKCLNIFRNIAKTLRF